MIKLKITLIMLILYYIKICGQIRMRIDEIRVSINRVYSIVRPRVNGIVFLNTVDRALELNPEL